jgi:hypothetical protein
VDDEQRAHENQQLTHLESFAAGKDGGKASMIPFTHV